MGIDCSFQPCGVHMQRLFFFFFLVEWGGDCGISEQKDSRISMEGDI